MHVESVSNGFNLQENQGDDVTLLAQTMSSVFNFSRADNHVSDALLDKSTIQRQKFAMYVNTRHMAPHHLETSVPYQSGASTSIPDATNRPLSIQELKSSLDTAETIQSQQMAEDITENAHSLAMDASKQNGISANASRNKDKGINTRKRKASHSIFLSKPKSHCSSTSTTLGPFSHHVTGTTPSTSQHTQVKPTNWHKSVRSRGQIHFMRKAQGWRDALQHIYKLLRDSELFGDEQKVTPDLLKLLKEIDKQKYDVTHEVEEAASLLQVISWVKRYLDDSTDEECIRLAERISKDFRQRFYGEHS